MPADGERNGKAKLSTADVKAIRAARHRRHKHGASLGIATAFRISTRTVRRIWQGITWQSIY